MPTKPLSIQLTHPCDPAAPLTQRFGENPQLYARFGLSGHNGLDFALPLDSRVTAAAGGVVTRLAHDAAGYGSWLQLTHKGFATLYAHLSRPLVCLGQAVSAGETIARSGSSGFSNGPHLHFELRLGGKAIDPYPYLCASEPAAGGATQTQPPQPGAQASPAPRRQRVIIRKRGNTHVA